MDEELFVDKHQVKLIQNVENTAAILEDLLAFNVLSQKSYDKIMSIPDSQEKMRELFRKHLKYSGVQEKEILYKVLCQREPYLINDLKRRKDEKVLYKERVATMVSVIELLLRTLKDLSYRESENFKKKILGQKPCYLHGPECQWMLLKTADMQDIVFSMVQIYGQRSVEEIEMVLQDINRRDLVEKLSKRSLGPRKKHSADKHHSALIHKVATMAATKELLLETLRGLSNKELNNFRWFLQFTFFNKNLPHIPWRRLLMTAGANGLVDMIMELCGQQSVEVTRAVFMDMNRMDLVQMLSEDGSGPKEKYSLNKNWPALNTNAEAMASVIELLLETLKDFCPMLTFKDALLNQTDLYRRVSHIPEILLHITDMQDIVFLIVQIYGQQSVEMIKLALEKMNVTHLVQKLSESSCRPQKKHSADKHPSTLIQRVATMAAVKQMLLETLNDLSNEELKKFKEVLQVIFHQKDLPDISPVLSYIADRAKIVDQMVETYGQQCEELTREVLIEMKRADLVLRLSVPSSGLEEKLSMDEHQPAQVEGAAAMPAVKEVLLDTLNTLDYLELERFKWLLQFTYFQKSLPQISVRQLEWADRADILVDLMMANQQPVEVTKEVFMDMSRTDLAQRLSSYISSGHKVKDQSELLQKEVPTASVQKKLLETLEELSSSQLEQFKHVLQYRDIKKGFPRIPIQQMEMARRADIVKLMVEVYGEQSVEVIREVLEVINRHDLMERLSDISLGSEEENTAAIWKELLPFNVLSRESYDKIMSIPDSQVKMRGHLKYIGIKEKEILYKLCRSGPYLINDLKRRKDKKVLYKERVATMVSVIELLLRTLKDLSYRESFKFKKILGQKLYCLHGPECQWMLLKTADMQDIVFSMVQIYGQRSVEEIEMVLQDINRRDLVEKLSKRSLGPRKKHSADKHNSALIHKVATMAATKELLLETLRGLSNKELNNFRWFLQFTFFNKNLPHIPWRRLLMTAGVNGLVDMIMELCGQQSVEVTRAVFMDMNRMDLVQMLSEDGSGPKEKYSLNKNWPALNTNAEAMASVIELLLETLKGFCPMLTFKDTLLNRTDLYRRVSHIPEILLHITDMQDIVFLIVQIYGQQSVEVIKLALEKMNVTHLVQKLSESSCRPQKKHSADKHPSTLIQRVATMAAVKQMLLETLNDLSNEELKKFKEVLQVIFHQKDLPDISPVLSYIADRAKIVDQMVETYGQQCEELTREVLIEMKRADLVLRLSVPSSGLEEKLSMDEHQPAQVEGAAAMPAVKEVLLDTLNTLDYLELERFKWLLQFTYFQKSLPQISVRQLEWADRADILVDLMMVNQQPVEVTKEVFMDMSRTDLAQRLSSYISSGHKVKHQSELLQKEVPTASVQKKLLETLEELSSSQLEQFKHVLQYRDIKKGFPRIPIQQMEMARRADIVKLMVEVYGEQSVEVIREVLEVINSYDLMERLSDISLGSEGPSTSMELKGCSSTEQESGVWTKLEAEVNSTDADEAPTYSLHSEAGNFECSVSGLRWSCKEKVSLKFQFCSWEEPMERIERLKYMPAGPLMDITVISGGLDEMYLPHWICIDDIPKILDKFAVLHINECGDVVEKVPEVTTSHVKLSEPIFSPRAALMKVGIPVKISCNVLIYYQPNMSFLKLHVYLIPHDPALQQAVDRIKSRRGYKIIEKPRPDKYLKMQQAFKLSADIETAKILPEEITLRYDSQDPNFYEVFIENPDRNFHLSLSNKNKKNKKIPQCEPVWNSEIRKDDYQKSAHLGDKHSVDERQPAQMQEEAAMTTERERLLKMLEHLKQQELKGFKWVLRDQDVLAGLPCISRHRLEEADMLDLVDLMLQTYSQQSVEVTKKVFKKINRNDLVHMLQELSSGSKGNTSG